MRMAGRGFVIVRVFVMMVLVIMEGLFIMIMRVGMIVRRVGFMAVDEHAGLARADAAAIDGFKDQGCAQVERRRRLLEQRGRDTGADEGAEQHVPAQAGEAFEIADTHGCFHLMQRRYLPVKTASGSTSFMEPER
jgi:hypothetical protein